MARLVVQPGSPAAWEIQLKEGANSLGRNPANDFKLDDPSVSGSHCQIAVENGNAVIRDLGSTNGTYVNRAPVKEAVLRPGQTIHLGGVELMFYPDAPAPAGAAAPRPAPGAPPLPPPRAAVPAAVARVSITPATAPGPGRPPAPIAPPPVAIAPSSGVGSGPCKFHPRTPGRYFCGQCQHFFCELCVNTRGQQKFCRACGVECAPAQVEAQPLPPAKGFYARLPGAFVFPFRGSGLLLLIFLTILLPAMRFAFGMVGFWIGGGSGMLARAIVLGYLFAYMQCIIHTTAVGDEEMPSLPSPTDPWEDLVRPFLQLLGVTLISFAPAIGVACWARATGPGSMGVPLLSFFAFLNDPLLYLEYMIPSMRAPLLSLFALGCLYFPMAFLAVAVLDTVAAANPLQVVPSIFRVPLEYLVAVIALAGVLGMYALGNVVLLELFPRESVIHPMLVRRGAASPSIAQMLEMFAVRAFWGLASLYLLSVAMRILGLLYVTRKEKLGWQNR